MRILQVVHNFPPEFRGGVERSAELLSLGLAARGHDVRVVCGSEKHQDEAGLVEETHDGLRVARIMRAAGLRNPVDVFEPQVVPLFEQILDEVSPQIVHVHHWWNLGDDLVRRATKRGIPVVVTLHDSFSTCALFFRLPDGRTPCDQLQTADTCGPCIGARFGVDDSEVRFQVATRRAAFLAELEAARAVLTPSVAHSQALRPHVPNSIRLQVVPLGSPDGLQAHRSDPRLPGEPLRILHFGHLSRLKGVELLMQAVRQADPQGASIRVTLAGEVVEPDLDLEGAHQVGPYSRQGLGSLAALNDVAVFPSLARESYGLVVDEALRLGLPVVVSDRGALSERIGRRGVVCPAGDVDALAEVLEKLAHHPSALKTLQDAQLPMLPTVSDHVAAVEEVYCRCLTLPLPPVDLETPLLRRVQRYHERIAEVLAVLSRQVPKDAS